MSVLEAQPPALDDAQPSAPDESQPPASLPASTTDDVASAVGPGLQPLPGPDGIHRGWDATTVSTAKCDMCHKQRCGTIQKCSECKLSVCMDCAVADRLRADARHALDPTAVDWTGPRALPKLRRLRASRTAGVGRDERHGAAKALRSQARGRRRRLPSRPVPSRATSTSFSSPASPLIDVASPALDGGGGDDADAWAQAYRCWTDEGGELALQPDDEAAADAASVLYRHPVTRSTKAASPVSAQTFQTEDAAEILVQMPRPPRSAAEQQQDRRPHGPPHGVLLPPVRSVPDSRQSGLLPPLRTLHPQLGVADAQLQPSTFGNRGLMLPQPPSSWTHAGHAKIAEHEQHEESGASSYNGYQTLGHSVWGAQQQPQPPSQAHQSSTTAATYCNESQKLGLYSTFPAASTTQYPFQVSPATPRVTSWAETFTDYTHGSYLPSSHDGRSQTYGPLTSYYPAEYHSTTVVPRAGIYECSSMPGGSHHAPPRPAVQEQGAALRSSAPAIQATEHPHWPLDRCLQLALARCWAQRIGDEPHSFMELRAAAYAAALDLGLPERHNAARAWLCEQQNNIGVGEGTRFSAVNVPPARDSFGLAGRGGDE